MIRLIVDALQYAVVRVGDFVDEGTHDFLSGWLFYVVMAVEEPLERRLLLEYILARWRFCDRYWDQGFGQVQSHGFVFPIVRLFCLRDYQPRLQRILRNFHQDTKDKYRIPQHRKPCVWSHQEPFVDRLLRFCHELVL